MSSTEADEYLLPPNPYRFGEAPPDDRAALAARHERPHICTVFDREGDSIGSRRFGGYDGEPCDTARALALPPDPERLARAFAPLLLRSDPILLDPDATASAIIAVWEADDPLPEIDEPEVPSGGPD